jgi:hypothetical protein
MNLQDQCMTVLNRVTKWRSVFAGWQLGTRGKEDPECQAVKDHRETTILLRIEASAFAAILLKKGICTHEELQKQFIEEAEALDAEYEKKFPGYKSTNMGMNIDAKVAAQTIKGWRP